jgi:hypothetical protein
MGRSGIGSPLICGIWTQNGLLVGLFQGDSNKDVEVVRCKGISYDRFCNI